MIDFRERAEYSNQMNSSSPDFEKVWIVQQM